MQLKSKLKKLKKGQIVRVNWIDAGDLDGVAGWFSDGTKVFQEIPVETISFYFGHGKENLFLVRDIESQDRDEPYYNGPCIIPLGCIKSIEVVGNESVSKK
jgi:hypothetical protein